MIRIYTFKQNKNKDTQNKHVFLIKRNGVSNDESKISADERSEAKQKQNFQRKMVKVLLISMLRTANVDRVTLTTF